MCTPKMIPGQPAPMKDNLSHFISFSGDHNAPDGFVPTGKLRLSSRIKLRVYVRRSTVYEKAPFY